MANWPGRRSLSSFLAYKGMLEPCAPPFPHPYKLRTSPPSCTCRRPEDLVAAPLPAIRRSSSPAATSSSSLRLPSPHVPPARGLGTPELLLPHRTELRPLPPPRSRRRGLGLPRRRPSASLFGPTSRSKVRPHSLPCFPCVPSRSPLPPRAAISRAAPSRCEPPWPPEPSP
jgi:hypothetical protein